MLAIRNITFTLEGKRLFDDASATIPAGHKAGFVGRNGSGKTTLFRLIRGELALDAGEIEVPRRARIGGVAQEAPATRDSLIDTVLAADTERAALHGGGGGGRGRAPHRRHPAPPGRHRRAFGRGPGGGDPARARLRRRGAGARLRRVLRRLADAGGARRGALRPPRRAAARRADELSRPRRRDLARELPRPLSAHRAGGEPRPRPPEPLGRLDPAPAPAEAHLLPGQLRHLRRHPPGAARAAGGGEEEAGRGAGAHAGLRRPLPLQGVEGAPGAEPHQGAGADEADRRGGRGPGDRLQLPRARGAVAADHPARGRRASATTAGRCSATSTSASTRTTASRCSARTARASRPSPSSCPTAWRRSAGARSPPPSCGSATSPSTRWTSSTWTRPRCSTSSGCAPRSRRAGSAPGWRRAGSAPTSRPPRSRGSPAGRRRGSAC